MASHKTKTSAAGAKDETVKVTPELVNRLQSAMRGEDVNSVPSSLSSKGNTSEQFERARIKKAKSSALRRHLIRSNDHYTVSIDTKAQRVMHNVFDTFGRVEDFDAWLNSSDKGENDRVHFISAAQGIMDRVLTGMFTFGRAHHSRKLTYLIKNGAIPTEEHAIRAFSPEKCSTEFCENLIHSVFIKNGFWADLDAFDQAQIHDDLSPIFSTWRKYQDIIENPTPMTVDLSTDVTTVEDIEAPDVTESNLKGRYTQYFIEGDDIYWQAARNLEFIKLLDIYVAEKKPFPHKALTNDKNDLKLAHLLAFAGEQGVWQKLMTPVLWGTNRQAMVDFYTDYMPETEKQGFDFDKVLKEYDQYAARRHIKRPNLS